MFIILSDTQAIRQSFQDNDTRQGKKEISAKLILLNVCIKLKTKILEKFLL